MHDVKAAQSAQLVATSGSIGALALAAALAATLLAPVPTAAQTAPQNTAQHTALHEASIERLHELMRTRQLTATQLVQVYLDRIAAYDKRGPSLNAITVVNPNALARAAELDAEFARTGRLTGALHGIPVIVKDNYDTADLPTAAGSRSLADALPPDDAHMVRRIRAAGGIVIAKSNMAEFAFSPHETVGSFLPGYTFNPYALNRVPAGSSGGTAAAVSANFGAVGIGTDTGNSIRGPAAHTALVGIRPTIGLTSRDGIAPLYLERDVGGPMTRTVADAARVLDVVAGYDAADTATAHAAAHIPPTYTASLDANALRGVRIGVVRSYTERRSADTAVVRLFEQAVRDLERAGAIIVDSVDVAFADSIPSRLCSSFRADIEAYLRTRPGVPQTLDSIIESGRFHVNVGDRLRSLARDTMGGDAERCRASSENKARFEARLGALLRDQRLDALVYPTWSNPPRLIGDLTSPAGDNSQVLSPRSGFPAITVPMGYTYGTLPAGLQFLGARWSEARLIGLAYAYEQATLHRRPPASTPPLR